MIRVTKKKAAVSVVAAALFAGIAVGAVTIADDGEGGGSTSTAPPGEVILGSGADVSSQTVSTSGSTFDPTILTKFIPGRAFIASQGTAGGSDDDQLNFVGQTCVSPSTASGGALTVGFASVELPDGARIKRVTFYGEDSNATNDITIGLERSSFSIPLLLGGSPSRSETEVTSFTTSGSGGVQVVSSADNLAELVGTPSSGIILSFNHRFHNVRVQFNNVAGATNVLCGVEIQYQVVASGEVSYHPISPVRAIDTRIAAYGASAGAFTPGTNRVISVADGHDLATGAVTLANAVPAGATAITYNLTAADPSGGSNFLAITAGDAVTFASSALNYNVGNIANGGTVPIAADRTVKIFNGGAPASTHVVIDITGYYTAANYPNMGN